MVFSIACVPQIPWAVYKSCYYWFNIRDIINIKLSNASFEDAVLILVLMGINEAFFNNNNDTIANYRQFHTQW